MSEHNFYDSLLAFAGENPLRLHMPGHKGKPLPMAEWEALARLDFTELPPTGDLYGDGDDWLEESQRLWAWDWGMDAAFYATGGSTQGIFTLFNLFTRPGDTVLVDRVSHKSVHHALALFDLRPIWLERPWLPEQAVAGAMTPEALEAALDAHPEATAVFVTSPTYYGVMTELEPLAELCHARGKKLLVDGAHGAHLPLVLPGEPNCLLGCNPYQCCDGFCVSTHKTLSAPGQTAVIFANGVSIRDLRAASALTSTTSPSFPMLAALDCLRPDLHERRGTWRKTAAACADLRRIYPSLAVENLDPCRVVLQVEDGFGLSERLQSMGIYAEMADRHHVVLIFTAADNERDFLRFKRALNLFGWKGKAPFAARFPAPPLPEQVLTPRQARFAPTREVSLSEAEGSICAQCVAPYPPGVPVIAPGERVTKKTLDYLAELCYDMDSAILTCAGEE